MITTWHCINGERDLKNKSVPGECYRIASQVAKHLTSIGIKSADCETAFASCFIQVMGKEVHNHNGDSDRSGNGYKPFPNSQCRWVQTTMRVLTDVVCPNHFSRRPKGQKIWSNSFSGADEVLGCFGLSVNAVLDHFGNVQCNERKVFDLATIVATLCPEILKTDKATVAA